MPNRQDAGRLTGVADTVAASNLGGTYAWNADGTLASMPGQTAGTRRTMSYDEEGRLTAISRLQGGVTTALFQYGHGFDGGRRWRKDLAGGVQDGYPCGVACCAGELVTLRSTDNGATWTTLVSTLDSPAGARYNATLAMEGTFGLTSYASLSGVGFARQVEDSFGVTRSGSRPAEVPLNLCRDVNDEAQMTVRLALAMKTCEQGTVPPMPVPGCLEECNKGFAGPITKCVDDYKSCQQMGKPLERCAAQLVRCSDNANAALNRCINKCYGMDGPIGPPKPIKRPKKRGW